METKKIINAGDRAVDEMLDGILAAHPRAPRTRGRQPARDRRASRAAAGQGRAGDRRRLGARADLPRLRRQGPGRRRGDRQRLRLAAARSDPRMRQGGQRRRGRAVHVRQLRRRRDELRHGGRDGGDGRHRGPHRADDRRRRLGAARPSGRSGAASPATSSSSRSPGAACDRDAARWTRSSASRARPTTRTFTMGVALSPCSLPQTRRPNFEIGDDEMEIGMGIHGEPGVAREPLRARRRRSPTRCMDRDPRRDGGRRAATRSRCWSTRSASTPLMELYIMNRRVQQRLDAARASASMRPGSATTAPRWRWPAPRSR